MLTRGNRAIPSGWLDIWARGAGVRMVGHEVLRVASREDDGYGKSGREIENPAGKRGRWIRRGGARGGRPVNPDGSRESVQVVRILLALEIGGGRYNPGSPD
jgi:hypothetical protein